MDANVFVMRLRGNRPVKEKVDQCTDAARHALSRSRLSADTKIRSEWLELADAWEDLSNAWTELWRTHANGVPTEIGQRPTGTDS